MHGIMKVVGYVVLGIAVLACGIWALYSWKQEEGFVLEHEEKEAEESETKEEAEALDSNHEAGSQAGNQGSDALQAVEEDQSIYVYVCGEVREPGVYGFTAGARVRDAIDAAGGFTEHAAVNYLNLAGWISDGEQIYVPNEDEVTNRPAVSDKETEAGGSYLVNINTAGTTELSSLAGIGEQRAKDIVAYREKHGAFSCIEDIMKVSGIKEATFERIKEQICVG